MCKPSWLTPDVSFLKIHKLLRNLKVMDIVHKFLNRDVEQVCHGLFATLEDLPMCSYNITRWPPLGAKTLSFLLKPEVVQVSQRAPVRSPLRAWGAQLLADTRQRAGEREGVEYVLMGQIPCTSEWVWLIPFTHFNTWEWQV